MSMSDVCIRRRGRASIRSMVDMSRPAPLEGPIRSLLFAPGSEPRKLARLGTSGADAVAIDLEDAVPEAQKDRSRELARAHLGHLGQALVCVRVNGMRSERTDGDVRAIVAPGLDLVILPKAESPAE